MVGLIVFLVFLWLLVAFVILGDIGDSDIEESTAAMMFFWPISGPILLVFGVIYCVWVSLATGINMFRKDA